MKINKEFQNLITPLTKEEYTELEKSILKEGCRDALIVWNDTLLDGHNRLKICKNHNIKFKTKEIKLKDKREAEAWIIKNQFARRNLSALDRSLLALKLEELLKKESKENLSKAGRGEPVPISAQVKTRDKIAKIAGVGHDTIAKVKVIKVEATEEQKNEIRKGDKTINGVFKEIQRVNNKKKIIKERKKEIIKSDSNIILGDCLKEIDKLKDKSISMILTDPPYGIDFVSNYRIVKDNITRPIKNDNERAFVLLEKMLEKSSKKLADNGSLYLFTTWKVIEKVKPIVSKYYNIKNILIWNKNNWGMGDLNNWADKYEMIIYADKGKHKLLGDRPVNVLDFDRTSYKYHSCEKPIDLLSYLIEKSTVEDELVFDPFLGSGSTAIACKKTKRKYLGIEVDKLNYNTALKRLNGNY